MNAKGVEVYLTRQENHGLDQFEAKDVSVDIAENRWNLPSTFVPFAESRRHEKISGCPFSCDPVLRS